MLELIKVFFVGMGISFLGSLPLGSLNVAAMQIGVQENLRNAFKFSVGVMLVEVIYVRFSLTGMNWVVAHKTLFNVLEWATVALFIVLAVSSFLAARKSAKQKKNILLNNKADRFLLGMLMSAINPVQIPFWFLWSTYLLSNHVIAPEAGQFNSYTIGIGIGTLLGEAAYIFGGRWLIQKLNAGQRAINIVVGIVFLVSAIIQLYRVAFKPSKLDSKEIREELQIKQ
jgi:threonine/homoserine/homoserine lactone efflux protein